MQALMMNASGVRRTPSCGRLALERDARDVHIGDVGVLVLRDVRQVDPARLQARAGDHLNARQAAWLSTGAELREVDFRHLRQSARRRAGGALRSLFTYAFTSSCVMRPFGPVPLILPRSAPSSRANLRTEGLA